jgi:hypothetical protein
VQFQAARPENAAQMHAVPAPPAPLVNATA